VTARVVLIRHGEAEAAGVCYGARHDPPLSARGRAQAAAIAHRWRGHPRVLTSPSARARETAGLLAPSPLVDPRFAERDFGEWEGLPWAQLWPTVSAAVQTDPAAYAEFTPPGGEPLPVVAARAWAGVQDAAAQGQTTVVVTSAGPIRLALAAALGMAPAAVFSIEVGHGSAATLRRTRDDWVLERLGA